MLSLARGGAFAIAFTLLIGCDGGSSATSADAPDPENSSPAASATNPSVPAPLDAPCTTNADCGEAEVCGANGTCELQRCAATDYQSSAPLGKRDAIGPARIPILGTSASVAGYSLANDVATAEAGDGVTVSSTEGTLLDVTGGDFFGARPEAMAFITSGANTVRVWQATNLTVLSLDFAPIAIAAGDSDGDGTDEVFALGVNGELSICHVPTDSCARSATMVPTGTYTDIAAIDVDGDGNADPILLSQNEAGASVITVSLAKQILTNPVTPVLFRISAGYGGTGPVIVGLEDGGYLGFGSDVAHAFTVGNSITEIANATLDDDTVDLAIDDIDGDGTEEVCVLTQSGSILVFGPDLSAKTTISITDGGSESRLAFADLDGDSAIATLANGPTVVPGNLVPTAVLVYPPFPGGHTSGTSQIVVGSSTTDTTSYSDTIGVKASLGIGFEVDVPAIAKASIMPRVEDRVDHTSTTSQSVTIADRYTIDATADMTGPDDAAVMLANGCYHAYTYSIDDPAGKLGAGADKTNMVLFVPVAGQTTLWSLARYNAYLAANTSSAPVSVPYIPTNPASYPTTAQTLSGAPIPQGDLVLSTSHTYLASDVGRVGWQLDISDANAQATTQTITVSAVSTVKVGDVVVTGEVGTILASTYTVSLGSDVTLAGSVPPINSADLSQYDYSFSPLVYLEHTSDGGGYYVVSYVVGE